MPRAIAAIDHIVIGVRDLEEAGARWRRLGFALTPRGRHIGRDTANCCVMFAGDYLELLGSAGPQAAGLPPRREGPCAVAFAPDGAIDTARALLLMQGLHPSEPRRVECRIEDAEPPSTLEFSAVELPVDETPGLASFLCEPLTPELLWRPAWLRHANGAIGLDGIHVLAGDTARLLAAYDRLFGLPAVTTTDAVVTVHAGRHRIVFSSVDDFRTIHPALAFDAETRLPAIAAIEFDVARISETAEFFGRQAIGSTGLSDGSLAVPAREANGAILIFGERRPVTS
jgi:hypothetical protein